MRAPRMPYGRHKGELFSDIPTNYLQWMVENFDDRPEREHALAELAGRKVPSRSGPRSCGDVVLKSGKYKGIRLRDLDMHTLHLVWSGWNGSPRLRQTQTFKDISQEIHDRKANTTSDRASVHRRPQYKKKQHPDGKPPRKPTDLSDTHYEWSHPKTGRQYRIPNDVVMDGRENEECPFDVEEPVLLWSPECDGDREFMDIIR